MTAINNTEITKGMKIPASAFALPTGGAQVTDVRSVREGEAKWPTGDYMRVEGRIFPQDPAAPYIGFLLALPENWNGKLLQIGGGGLDGSCTPVEMPVPGRTFFTPAAMKEGYAVIDCDGGHQTKQENPFDCSFGLNQEAKENYAWKAQKKTHDVGIFLLRKAYGTMPERVYYAGGSNGGRECLKALEHNPSDYQGAICMYPVQQFIGKALFDSWCGNELDRLGNDAVIHSDTWHEIQKKIIEVSDGADGLRDGVISDLGYARAHREETRKVLSSVLNSAQLAYLDILSTPFTLPFPLACGGPVTPEYAVYEGAPVYEILNGFPFLNAYGSGAGARDTMSVAGGDGILSCIAAGDPGFDFRHPDYLSIKDGIQEASGLFDVSDSALDGFRKTGGKVLLVQGMADPLLSPYITISYFERLKKHYGEKDLHEFLRFYMVPGYGHGFGENFAADMELLKALDGWTEKGQEPGALTAADANDPLNHRTRPIYEYPYYPAWNGQGDPTKAESFHPERMTGF